MLLETALLSAEEVQRGVVSLGQRISADYAGKEVTLICILKGAVMFTADLKRQLTVPTRLDFIAISSYGAGTKSSGVVKILKDLDEPIEGIQPNIVSEIGDVIIRLNRARGKEVHFEKRESSVTDEIRDAIVRVNREMGVTVLLVEQKQHFVKRVADRFLIMDKGRIVAGGTMAELTEDLVRRYLTV